jgi:hypothetical protein
MTKEHEINNEVYSKPNITENFVIKMDKFEHLTLLLTYQTKMAQIHSALVLIVDH